MVPVYGGPHDGSERVTREPSCEFVWFDGKRCYRKPAKSRALYRLMRRPSAPNHLHVGAVSGYVLVYVQSVYTLCKCGVYHSRSVETCTLCGALLTVPS